ncbi:hypothetical protein [Saccharibacillus kuerlensis]|uniref:hypothetical protein n=1 Tax=Saccharibacillus kuerlensis TaxID=459527 RepID=UPI000A019CC0|nr:hypothetical protein [Saccharibacillus kuerlensis]
MFKKIVDKIIHSAGHSSHSGRKRGSSSAPRRRGHRYGSSSDSPRYSRSSSSDYRHGRHGNHGHSYYKRKSKSSS